MEIKELSPHLAGVLDRLAPERNERLLNHTFSIAIAHGGLTELDFVRPEGASYNPRPARLGLILLQDTDIRSSEVLAAGFLSTSWNAIPAGEKETLSEEICLMAQIASEKTPLEIQKQIASIPVEAAVLAVVAYLDRARHLHLAPTECQQRVYAECVHFLTLAKTLHPRLHLLLESWQHRYERRMSNRRTKE